MDQNSTIRTALVIDDNRQVADSICKLLDLFNIQADAVYGSRPGLIALRGNIPDLILLDINMPGLSGYEVLSYIQREPNLTNTKVVVITSDDQEETTQRSLREGASLVIHKPLTIEAIEKIIAT